MALEAVVFPQGSFTQCSKELYAMVGGGGPWGCDFGELEEEEKRIEASECGEAGDGSGVSSSTADNKQEMGDCVPTWSSVVKSLEDWGLGLASPEEFAGDGGTVPPSGCPASAGARRKRRRMQSCKNREEVENQRMTHIAVERNRRKQMNEYLSVLRSIMPPAYVQRGDQASIIGGAINFVKELEQLLQSMEAQKRIRQRQQQHSLVASSTPFSSPFSGFFTFPQYSSSGASPAGRAAADAHQPSSSGDAEADIEVTMVESHANLKVLSRRRSKQLLRMVAGLQRLRLAVLHLNVTTVDEVALHSFSLKVEEDCQLSSVDEIAAAVHQILGKIEEDGGF